MATTVIHLLRHGEVDNPRGILYGNLPNFHLSELGRQMAERAAKAVAERDVVRLVSSPLERARETAAPIASTLKLPIATDERLREPANAFEGERFGVGAASLRKLATWRRLRNPLRPSWGEPYRSIVVRVLAAMADARAAAEGHEAVLVTHQLPIWVVRRYIEGRPLWHDPRRRQCALASLTTFTYDDDRIVSVEYSEPAADLLSAATPSMGA